MADTRRISQADRALIDLRTLLLDGAFEPGERLSEPTLAERLDVSRTPVREAISRLIEEGLLERVETGGCRVSSYTMQEVIAAIEIRGTMEGLAARMAAERGALASALKECRALLDAIDKALGDPADIDFNAYVSLNATFHDRIARLAGSEVIAREVGRVSRLPLASPSAFLRGQEAVPEFRASLFGAQSQHKAILDAIEAREGTRAEAMAREHARLARHNLEYAMTRDRSLVRRIPGLALVSEA